MASIELDDVTKEFADGTTAVDGVSMTIEEGEFFILVGPSGCGKSTLLNMIVGLEDVTSGDIRVDGESVTGVDPKDRNMAMVFQSYAIYPHMTVRENVAFPLQLAKVEQSEIDDRVARAAELLELDPLLDRKPAALSGGQRQRVAMGRAIVRDPVAFLMDEPLSNLDAKLRTQMRTEVAQLQRELGTTTVYVTHDQTEAMTLGHRVAVLRGGVVQQVASPRELYTNPANTFVAGFIGSPAMNFLPGDVADGKLSLPMGEVDVPSSWPEQATRDGRVIVGARPEHFADASSVDGEGGLTFSGEVEVLEWLGSDLFATFGVEGRAEEIEELFDEIEQTGRLSEGQSMVIARLHASSGAEVGDTVEFWLDTEKVGAFDPDTGENLTLESEPDEAGTPRDAASDEGDDDDGHDDDDHDGHDDDGHDGHDDEQGRDQDRSDDAGSSSGSATHDGADGRHDHGDRDDHDGTDGHDGADGHDGDDGGDGHGGGDGGDSQKSTASSEAGHGG